jgi:ATP-dependent protease ClpP protease subunit
MLNLPIQNADFFQLALQCIFVVDNTINTMITATGKTQRSLTITAESKNGKAYVRIIGRISNWNSNNSKDFQKNVDELLKVYDDCEVYINSEGGSVFEAVEINNQLKRFKNVTVTVGSMAASAATYFIACYPTTASMNSQIMIHKPMLSAFGNETEIESQLKLLKNVTKDYLAKYSKKTGKTTKEIEDLWSSGDYWMSSTEAKADGFIDFIDDEVEAVITPEDILVLEACGAPIIPTPTNRQTNIKSKYKMDREELIAFLGLDANATDDQIAEAKSKMKIDALKHRETLTGKKDTPGASDNDDDDDDQPSAEVKALVEAGVKAKKYSAKESKHYTELATANFESTKAIIDAMPSKPKLTANLNEKGEGEDGAQANWKYEDYLEQDPSALEALWATEPEKAKKLEAAYLAK